MQIAAPAHSRFWHSLAVNGRAASTRGFLGTSGRWAPAAQECYRSAISRLSIWTVPVPSPVIRATLPIQAPLRVRAGRVRSPDRIQPKQDLGDRRSIQGAASFQEKIVIPGFSIEIGQSAKTQRHRADDLYAR